MVTAYVCKTPTNRFRESDRSWDERQNGCYKEVASLTSKAEGFEALELMWQALQNDHPVPQGVCVHEEEEHRSLSVGDVLYVDGVGAFEVRSMGFAFIGGPLGQ